MSIFRTLKGQKGPIWQKISQGCNELSKLVLYNGLKKGILYLRQSCRLPDAGSSFSISNISANLKPNRNGSIGSLKVHKIEIFFGFDFEICIISLLVM